MSRYNRLHAGEWVRPVMQKYRMMCCDCGLVHVIDFKVVKWGRGHKVKFRADRHNRATASARRAKRFLGESSNE
jgi:hypothetical protein